MHKLLSISLIVFLFLSPFILIVNSEPAEAEGNITFMPNVIPFTTVYKEVNKTSNIEGSGERFRFEWNNPLDVDDPNRFDIELFFNATIWKKQQGVWQNVTKMWSLHDFEGDFNCTIDFMKNQNESMVQWGWEINNPDITNEWIHQGWMRIEDTYPFEVDDIQQYIYDPEYNTTTSFLLPDNLVLSFEDLLFKGFMINVPSQTDIVVMGFEGKTHLNLDPITYSAPTITVTGYSEATPCTFWDVWNASNVNGWGAVFNYDNMTYFFNSSKLKIMSGGWFADTHVQAQFNVTTEIPIFNDSSNFQLGTLEDSVNKVTSGGVSILFDLAGGANDLVFYADAGSTTKLYGCIIESQNHHSTWYVYHSSACAYYYETIFSGLVTRGSTASIPTFDLKRVTQTAGTFGAGTGLYQMEGTFDDVSIEGNLNGIQQSFGTITNLKARNNTNLAYLYNYHSHCYLVNAEVDVWHFTFVATFDKNVYRQYTYDLTVTFPNGTAVENANVTITHYGQGETEDYNGLTDSDGEIPQQTLSKGFYNYTGGDTIYSYEPYNLQIANVTGYTDYNGNFTLSAKTDWTITLTSTTVESGASYFAPAFLLAFIICLALMIVWIKK